MTTETKLETAHGTIRFSEHSHWDEKIRVEESTQGDAMIFREVAVLGLVSSNPSITGKPRQYSEEGVQRAIPLYENARVFLDHTGPAGSPSVDRLAGKLEGIYYDAPDRKLRARKLEVQLTDKTSHALKMMKTHPDLVGLSHDISGKESGEGIIEEITKVHSVDIVAAPATNTGLYEAEVADQDVEEAVWDTAYRNDLPDSAFLLILPGGEKEGGKTVPRSLRKFPYKDAEGKVDLPHLRNALSRIPQAKLPPAIKARLTSKAQKILQDQKEESEQPSSITASAAETRVFSITQNPGGGIMDKPNELMDELAQAVESKGAEVLAMEAKVAEAEAKIAEAETRAAEAESRAFLEEALTGSSLPDVSKDRLRVSLAGSSQEEITNSVAKEAEYIEAISAGSTVSVSGCGPEDEAPVADMAEAKKSARDGILLDLGFTEDEVKEVR